MNQARLRPPYPVWRVLFGLAAVPVVWGTMALAFSRLPLLPALYWKDYLKATFSPDVEGLKQFKLFGKAEPVKLPVRQILCECPVTICKAGVVYAWPPDGLAATEERLPEAAKLHWVLFSSQRISRAVEKARYANWLRLNIYGGKPAAVLLFIPLMVGGGLAAMLFGVGFYLDYQRRVKFRDVARHIEGPEIISARQFARCVPQTGLGIELDRTKWERVTRAPAILRIPREKESMHLLAVGDTGSGKTQTVYSLLDQALGRGETAIVFDSQYGDFVKRYYDPRRGDVILGLDERAAAWNPSDEVDFSSEAMALATSLAQAASVYSANPTDRNYWFMAVAQQIWQTCVMDYRPNAAQLANIFEHACFFPS
jgi:hypothetical protein